MLQKPHYFGKNGQNLKLSHRNTKKKNDFSGIVFYFITSCVIIDSALIWNLLF